MPYTEVNDTIAVGLVNDWINLARDWGVANGNQPERDRLEKLMDQLAEDMRDRCLRDLAVIERGLRRARYFTWDRAAERMLKIYTQAREA